MNITRLNLICCDVAALVGSLWLGYQLRFDFAVPEATQQSFLPVLFWVVTLKLFCLWRLHEFEVLLGYFGIPDFCRLLWASFLPSLLVFGISSHFGSEYAPPRGVV